MRTLLAVTIATAALATGAYAQSSGYSDDGRAAFAQSWQAELAAAARDRTAPTDISRQCGVDYAIQDPDASIRLDLLRTCNAGIEGGGD
jgi:hypothetical protein